MDKIEAKANIDVYKQKIVHLHAYNHLHSTASFKRSCEVEIIEMKSRIRFLEKQLSK